MGKTKSKYVLVTEDYLQNLAKESASNAAKEAIAEFEKQKKRSKKSEMDWRLGRVDLLLKNYRLLKIQCLESSETLEDYIFSDFLEEGELTLDNLLENKAKTLKMMTYFDTLLKVYKNLCEASLEQDKRRYKAIERLYIKAVPTSKKELAKQLHVDRKTIDRDVKKAVNDLAIMLFGISAVPFN